MLFVLAHPDDESFMAAGTIAKYAESGVRVGLVCGTRGERGATADLCSIDELPRVREAELREATRILGVQDLYLLPYQDQHLMAAPVNDIRRHLIKVIRALKPNLVITFDPNGANQHTDHVAISRFTADAVSAAADHRWFPEIGPAHNIERLLWQSEIPVYGLSQTPDLATRPGVDFVIDTAPWWRKKKEALQAHRTQLPGFRKLFFNHGSEERTLSVEAFRVGWGPRPKYLPAMDLFAI
jgi:LmbE family N-acetylglucosaminyl deacetylase